MSLTAYLIFSVGLFFVMVMVQAVATDIEHGITHSVGARDGAVDKGVLLQRAKRANQNMIEGLVMFVPLALLAIQSGQTGKMASVGAAMFFFGRLAYAPLYWFGVPWLRSGAWFLSIIGIILIFINLLPLI